MSDPTLSLPPSVEAVLPKPWWQSRTVIGAAVTLVSGVGAVAGYGISDQTQAQLTDLLAAGGALVGGVLALWGRIRADRAVSFRSPR